MIGIERHYRAVRATLALDWRHADFKRREPPSVLVPIARLDKASLNAIEFARSISDEVTAVHVTDDPVEADAMKREWRLGAPDVDLVILESPYRALVAPLMTYIDARETTDPDKPLTVVIPEFVPRHFWERLLHNQVALRLRLRLAGRRNTVVVGVPYHLA
jgi:hypothetical protein